MLMVFLVTQHCPTPHEDSYSRKCSNLMSDAVEITTSNKNGSNGINKIVHGGDIGG